jgi:hypothetical protein
MHRGKHLGKMQTAFRIALLFSLGSCAKGSKPASPVSRDGGETDIIRSCEGMQSKVEGLYEAEAIKTEVPPNRRSEFISANTHMVLSDCRLSPAESYSCLQHATTVAQMEHDCLVFLDDEGTVEGFQFGSQR